MALGHGLSIFNTPTTTKTANSNAIVSNTNQMRLNEEGLPELRESSDRVTLSKEAGDSHPNSESNFPNFDWVQDIGKGAAGLVKDAESRVKRQNLEQRLKAGR